MAQVDTMTEVVWAALHGLVMLSITKRLRPGRALHRARLEQLTAAIVAIFETDAAGVGIPPIPAPLAGR